MSEYTPSDKDRAEHKEWLNWSPKNGRHEVCYFDFVEDI